MLAQRSTQWNEQILRRLERKRHATRGYSKVPNWLLENFGCFPVGEHCIALIICRRGAGCSISDIHYVDWTDKDPRNKEIAIAGLLKKGIISVEGHGDKARYTFHEEAGIAYVESQPRGFRPRTHGRKETVAAKPEMHPDCRARGCQKAAACEPEPEPAGNLLQFPEAENAKPVSRNEIPDLPEKLPVMSTTERVKPKQEPLKPPKSSGGVDYPLALAAVQKYFPHADEGFMKQLRLKIQADGTTGYTDLQLAQCIHAAYKPTQLVEGLFLLTVPRRLATKLSQMRPQTRKDQSQQCKSILSIAELVEIREFKPDYKHFTAEDLARLREYDERGT